jgi:cobalt transporter subunit CbtB
MSSANTKKTETTVVSNASVVRRIAAIACVGLFGLGLVWAAGFANAETLHNAAHDSRHSLAFPCH